VLRNFRLRKINQIEHISPIRSTYNDIILWRNSLYVYCLLYLKEENAERNTPKINVLRYPKMKRTQATIKRFLT